MEFRKNQELIFKIEDLGNHGEGIGRVDGYALFVKGALPGETVRASIMKCGKSYGFARLLEVLDSETAQAGRVEPKCPVARQCGGCTLQHLSYERQLVYKEKKVKDCLTRIGGVDLGEVEWFPILGMGSPDTPWHYRNKAQFPVGSQHTGEPHGCGKSVVGFYAERSHRIIPVTDCAIQDECMKGILERVLWWMEENHVPAYDEKTHRGLVRHIYIRKGYHTGEIMVCLVVNGKIGVRDSYRTGWKEKWGRMLVQTLWDIPGMTSILMNENRERTNVILGKKTGTLWGREYIEDMIGDVRYQISPQAFFQVNPVQTEKLYGTVLEFAGLTGKETVWDLYCGIGTISLFLAQKAKMVYGVEIVPEAVQNARDNARINRIQNAEFFCGAAEEAAPNLTARADVVVVDPPRKGCDAKLLDAVIRMAPERIVYVSCDPATLARDVKVLGEGGYEVRKVRACDMFPQGGHVEVICLLSKLHAKQNIEVKLKNE